MQYIQSFGSLIVINATTYRIQAISANVKAILNSNQTITGKHADQFLTTPTIKHLKSIQQGGLERYCYESFNTKNTQKYLVNFFKINDSIYLEVSLNRRIIAEEYINDGYYYTSVINTANTKHHLYKQTVKAFKEITGYNKAVFIDIDNSERATTLAETKSHLLGYVGDEQSIPLKKIDDRPIEDIIAKPIRYSPNIHAKTIQIMTKKNETLAAINHIICKKLSTHNKQFFKGLNADAFSIFYCIYNNKVIAAVVCLNSQPKEILAFKRKDLIILCQNIALKIQQLDDQKAALRNQKLQNFIINFNERLKKCKKPLTLLKSASQQISTKLNATSSLINYYGETIAPTKASQAKIKLARATITKALKHATTSTHIKGDNLYLLISLSEDNSCYLCFQLDNSDSHSIENIILLGEQARLFLIERLAAIHYLNQAIKDPLTQLYNRQFLQSIYPKQSKTAARKNQPLSIAMLDIDKFKAINDTYGHDAGDQVLIHLANFLCKTFRSTDSVCRYGGEEFIILMPDSDCQSAVQRCNEALNKYRKKKITIDKKTSISITFSAGVACQHSTKPLKMTTLIKRADKMLYQAKDTGRNQVLGEE
ncbi:MAG: diguanylate cyclase [Coxiellaceae bacterium]|nr:diguanylate cyclase [Coxiellaceae bacterium]